MKYKTIFSALLLMACSSMALGQDEQTATFSITLNDSDGVPVDNGVFLFEPQFEVEAHQMPQQEPAIMNQIDKQFEPHVLVVKAGTEVTFPNADNLFHHVYSFSPTKQFELKLYKEFTAEPLRFDTAGVVDIGCNIHDWMYINGKTKKEKALADFIFDQNIKTLINSEKDSAFKYYIKRTIGKIYVTTARFAYLFEEMFVR